MDNLVCNSGKAGRADVVGVFVAFVIVCVAAAVLFPMFAQHGHTSLEADCQSNLMQIGRALKLYLADWHDTYPTNRVLLANGKLGRVASHIKLTPADDKNSDGTPARFRYGVNWVEALSPFMEQISMNSNGAWRCQSLGSQTYPENSNTAAVSYAFNRNLIGRPEQAIHTASNLMVVREMDRLVDAELRPANYSCGLPDAPPDSPFLTTRDSRIGSTKPELHSTGSNVVFADGHVKWFSAEWFPDQRHITAKLCWDSKDRQWYNCLDPRKPSQYKSIAITP